MQAFFAFYCNSIPRHATSFIYFFFFQKGTRIHYVYTILLRDFLRGLRIRVIRLEDANNPNKLQLAPAKTTEKMKFKSQIDVIFLPLSLQCTKLISFVLLLSALGSVSAQ